MKIAVLIPTFGRPTKLKPLLNNFIRCSTQANIYFLYDSSDETTKLELQSLQDFETHCFACKGDYVAAINYGYKNTSEEFVFCGADDILFTQDWDKKLLEIMSDQKIMMTGGIDDWVVSQSGIHTSHPMFRRSYCETIGSAWNEVGVIYSNKMLHYHVDLENEQLAWCRGVIKICKDCIIHHNSFVNGKADYDATYQKARLAIAHDTDIFKARLPNYQWWDWSAMVHGRAEPTSRKQRLSIIMPIYNCMDITKQTLESLCEKTKNKWELILVNDNSTEFKPEKIYEWQLYAYEHGFVTVRIVQHSTQKYCNASWNDGVTQATGDYIAIINNDLIFETQDWDEILLKNKGYDLISPFTRIFNREPFQTDKFPQTNSYRRLAGWCFVMTRQFAERIFPIPSTFKHWCGDSYISNQSETFIFDNKVIVRHLLSKSSCNVGQSLVEVERQDLKNYWEAYHDETFRPLLKKYNISI